LIRILHRPTLFPYTTLFRSRWEMIRMAVLPFGRPGIVSAAMLGLGRALGETMAVAMVLSATGLVSFKLLTSENPSTIADGFSEVDRKSTRLNSSHVKISYAV